MKNEYKIMFCQQNQKINGNEYIKNSYKICLPPEYLKEMGIDEDSRKVKISFNEVNKQIIIEKSI